MVERADYASHKMPVMYDLRFVQQYMVADPGQIKIHPAQEG